MNLFDKLYSNRVSNLTFKLFLKLRGGEFFLIAPANQHSLVSTIKGLIINKKFRSNDFFSSTPIDFGEVEVKLFITVVEIRKHAYIFSQDGFIKETIAVYKTIANNQLKYIDPFNIFSEFSIPFVLDSLGYLTHDNTTKENIFSIREFLTYKSNDYSLLNVIWQKIFRTDITDFDASKFFLNKENFFDNSSISIIIPCFNSNDTIVNTVEAAFISLDHLPSTSFKEVIIVDDSKTLDVKFNKDQVKIISSDFKLNCGGARNTGLAVAKGNYIFFIDSDTYIAENYIINHILRHKFFPNFILVSMREQIKDTLIPERLPNINMDTRIKKTYGTRWKTLDQIKKSISVMPLKETNKFKNFGYGKKIGPTDLPFMVKGNNLSFNRRSTDNLLFCNQYQGWGPEDVSFAAKLISKGFFVLPILSTGVFHVAHEPRSGSIEKKEVELDFNLRIHDSILNSHPYETW